MFSSTMIKFALAAVCGVMAIGWSVPVDAKVAHCGDCGQVACDCCPAPCISYHHHRTLRRTCCGCCDPINAILEVTDPVCCTTVEVPVCLPGCCDGVPTVCPGRGLLGRGVVEYQWCCGYRVKVVFKKCGDIVVHSYGR